MSATLPRQASERPNPATVNEGGRPSHPLIVEIEGYVTRLMSATDEKHALERWRHAQEAIARGSERANLMLHQAVGEQELREATIILSHIHNVAHRVGVEMLRRYEHLVGVVLPELREFCDIKEREYAAVRA